ncbi:hypothetical protein CHS0354_032267 [Potamilus streckersoni]|uniref:Uncharacterized protein n=1 Tax=Potamilus streckersoni TaxID=2493646 RepID=A0AAE0RPU6_9BIVA|nr:hypothetical protein CHS0354_032267 [Potamilus streckersoni]
MAAVPTIVQPSPKLIGTVEGSRDWKSGLFGCFSDCKSLILTYCCLPCAICSISSRTGECICMPYFVPGGLIALRARIRTLGGIRGSICCDCMALYFCGMCTICTTTTTTTATDVTLTLLLLVVLHVQVEIGPFNYVPINVVLFSQGSICSDCMALSFCGMCAVCQMQRELDNMGL